MRPVGSGRVNLPRRDNLLHEDETTFDHHLERLVAACRTNPLVHKVLAPLEAKFTADVDGWLQSATQRESKLVFPDDCGEELVLRHRVIAKADEVLVFVRRFGIARGAHKSAEWIPLFLSVMVRLFADDLTHPVGEAANMATPEAHAIQSGAL